MPSGIEIDHSQPLNGSMASYAQQVLISTGQRDWLSRIEDDGMDKGWGTLARQLKKLLGRNGKFSDPYNNIMITNSSFKPSNSSSTQTPATASAFLFPSFRYIPDIPLDVEGLDRFVKAFLLPITPHTAHDILPEEKRNSMKRIPELADAFTPTTIVEHSPTILICGHGGRDQRCGELGPILKSEFTLALQREGFTVGESAVDQKDHANVGIISHIGGHKFAGNVIIYLPTALKSSEGRLHSLAGKGIWYGRVEPRHVEGIVKETILNGLVIQDHFRGGIDKDGKVLWL
ncbi:Altered inheritance of mitochondria protein 32 [Myotisia sp. PD_48]|nr:Altered inheritance of mitochondria protein 32 [Myotisia sp. PD_48]